MSISSTVASLSLQNQTDSNKFQHWYQTWFYCLVKLLCVIILNIINDKSTRTKNENKPENGMIEDSSDVVTMEILSLKALYFDTSNDEMVRQQFVDRIHCHFFHSFDIGYKLTHNEKHDILSKSDHNRKPMMLQILIKI